MTRSVVVLLIVVSMFVGFSGGATRVHSDPRPVLGLYSVPANACSLVAAAGFNVVHSYEFETRDWQVDAYIDAAGLYLEEAHRWGLRVLLGIPRRWARDRNEVALTRAIESLAAHPALLAWYEEEMFLNGDLESVLFMDRVVQLHDATNGFILEESRPDARLVPLGRQRMFTWYPVTDRARRRGRLSRVQDRFPVAEMPRAPWPSLQIFGRDTIAGYDERDFVSPSWHELQYCLYASLISGAPAVFFYSYLQPTRYDKQRLQDDLWPWVDYEGLDSISPVAWRSARRAVEQAKALLDWIGSAEPDGSFVVPGEKAHNHASWSREGERLILLANPEYAPVTRTVPVGGYGRYRMLLPSGWTSWQSLTGRDVRLELPGPGGLAVVLAR